MYKITITDYNWYITYLHSFHDCYLSVNIILNNIIIMVHLPSQAFKAEAEEGGFSMYIINDM